jgi:hypothetical protein
VKKLQGIDHLAKFIQLRLKVAKITLKKKHTIQEQDYKVQITQMVQET